MVDRVSFLRAQCRVSRLREEKCVTAAGDCRYQFISPEMGGVFALAKEKLQRAVKFLVLYRVFLLLIMRGRLLALLYTSEVNGYLSSLRFSLPHFLFF